MKMSMNQQQEQTCVKPLTSTEIGRQILMFLFATLIHKLDEHTTTASDNNGEVKCGTETGAIFSISWTFLGYFYLHK